MNRAAIDMGSNSLLLTVLDAEGRVLHDEARVVGLGRGLGQADSLAPDRMAAAEVVLDDYLGVVRAHGLAPEQVRAVATSAARRAENAGDWLEALRRRTGLTVRVLSGQEEARLTYLGAISHLPGLASPTAVVDLGGGSTEVVFGHAERIEYWISLEIGTVRATEACHALGRVEVHHRRALEELAEVAIDGVALPGRPAAWVAVAATPTTLAAMHLGLDHYDAERVHGCVLDRRVLGEIADQLTGIEPAARRELCRVSPERADYLVAGCTVLDRLLARQRADSYRVSDRGLRFGLLEQTSQ